MTEMKLKDFLLKVGDYVRIRLNVYFPNKEDVQEVVELQQIMCDVMSYDSKFSQELRDKVEGLMDYTVEYIGTEVEEEVVIITLDITKD